MPRPGAKVEGGGDARPAGLKRSRMVKLNKIYTRMATTARRASAPASAC